MGTKDDRGSSCVQSRDILEHLNSLDDPIVFMGFHFRVHSRFDFGPDSFDKYLIGKGSD